MQALCVKTQTEHYRRLKGDEWAYTMGAIYWQLNDIWQAPTWASLEYGGKWKLLHYYAQDFFAPVLVSSYEENGLIVAWVTSDINRPLNGNFSISLWNYAGKLLTTVTVPYALDNLDSAIVYVQNIATLTSGRCASRSECFLYLSATENSGAIVSNNVFYLSSLASVNLFAAKFSLTRFQQVLQNVTFTITSDQVAPYVFLETPIPGVFSDNGFLLFPNVPFNVEFEGWGPVDNFQANLKVRTLSSIY